MTPILLASQGTLAGVLMAALLLAVISGLRLRARGAEDKAWPTSLKVIVGGLGCLLLIAGILLIAIGILVHGPIVRADAVMARFLFAHRQPWLDSLMMLASALGDGLERTVGTIVLVVYLLWRRRGRWALALALVMIAAAVLTPTLKTTFHFARPSMLYSGADAFSFPSGHATSAGAFYILLAWISAQPLSRAWRPLPWVLAGAIILLTGLSRLYLGAHWLSDVMAGFALGGALGVAGVMLAASGPSEPAPAQRYGLHILLALIAVALVLGPKAYGKAERLYAPYLRRPADRVVDPGHLGDPEGRRIVAPPSV